MAFKKRKPKVKGETKNNAQHETQLKNLRQPSDVTVQEEKQFMEMKNHK